MNLELPDFTLSRYGILLILLGCIGGLLYLWGFFKFVKNVAFDCLMDHKTGYYTINNVARFFTAITFLFLFIAVHFEVHIKPTFIIKTVPFSEWELAIVLGFIIGAEWVKKTKANTNQDSSTNPSIE